MSLAIYDLRWSSLTNVIYLDYLPKLIHGKGHSLSLSHWDYSIMVSTSACLAHGLSSILSSLVRGFIL